MDANVEKSCLEEISHFVCDENRKVKITEISNNWSISYKDSESILMKWLSNYKGDKTVLKEYLIRGVDLNGNCVITVVPERKLEALEQICPKYKSSLYSIELDSGSGRHLNISQPAKNKFISLKLESSERKCHVVDLPVSPTKPIKTEPSASKPSTSKGVNALFGAGPIKKEITTNGAPSQVKVKDEKSSPKKTASPKKISPKKATAKPATAKSISSFFSAKPGASKPAATKPAAQTQEKPVKVEPKVEPAPVQTKVIDVETPKESKKRVLSQSDDESIPGTPQAKKTPANKKLKKAPVRVKNDKAAKNRSRIMQICDSDSSSDDEGASTSKKAKLEDDEEQSTAKKEKENTTPTKNDTPESMETEEDNGTTVNGTQKQKKRGKVKKMVTKTFEDEEGFINSIRVMEEVSCSEDEVEEVPVEKKPSTMENGSSKEPAVKEKKKISPPTGKKQGSILSFFSKK